MSESLPPSPNEETRVTERQLRWGLWFIGHRLLLKRIGYGALIAIAAGSWIFTIWGVIEYGVLEGAALDRDLRQLATQQRPSAAIVERLRPAPLEIAEILLISNGGTSYDAVVRVKNPNSRWLAEVEYVLEIPGAPEEIGRTVLLPGRERWLTRLNASSPASPARASLLFRRVRWNRVLQREAPDIERFIDTRLRLSIRDAKFIPPRELAFGGGASANEGASRPSAPNLARAEFTVDNLSAYGFRAVEFTVLLRRGAAVVAVNRTTISDLRSGESRRVAVTWFNPVGLVTAVEAVPYVNVFDLQSFLEP